MIKSARQVHSLPVIFANTISVPHFKLRIFTCEVDWFWHLGKMFQVLELWVQSLSEITRRLNTANWMLCPNLAFLPRVWDDSSRAERCKILIFLLNARLLTYSHMLLLIECEDFHHCITLHCSLCSSPKIWNFSISQYLLELSVEFCSILQTSKGRNYDWMFLKWFISSF